MVWSSNTDAVGQINESTTTELSAFDGQPISRWSVFTKVGNRLEVNFNPSSNGNLVVNEYSSTAATYSYKINGSEVATSPGFDVNTDTDLGSHGTINSFRYEVKVSNDDGSRGGFCQLKLNGKILEDATSVVSVISTDTDNSKMTVDGGDWSDGSGVPSDQNQDEVLE